MRKKVLIVSASIVGAILLALVGFVLFLTVTEYNPDEVQAADRVVIGDGKAVSDTLTVYSWNIGYAGLGRESDFFMDGGKMVAPPGSEIVEKNLAGIMSYIESRDAHVWLLQEVDVDSSRSDSTDMFKRLCEAYDGSAAFAYNYKCAFVPFPMPPIGKVSSGLATVTDLKMDMNAERVSLPCPFSWPVRTANLKRCLLVTRIALEDKDKELVIINLHLEAYDSGEGRLAQTEVMMDLMQKEYEKGNYVIAGGDFNQTFPGMLDMFPITDSDLWTPGTFEKDLLPDGWQFAYDHDTATCRSLDRVLSDDIQLYSIDGFIVSPNVEIIKVEADGLGFEHSDHNPVMLTVRLLP